MTIGARIRQKRKLAHLSQSEVAAYFGIKPPSVSDWERDESAPDINKLAPLARLLKTTPGYLLTGFENAETISGDNFGPGPDIRGHVPVVSWVTAGNWAEVIDLHAPGVAEDWRPCPKSHGPRTFALRVRGVSMENLGSRKSYSDGDIIFIDPDRQADHGAMVVVRMENDKEATFKELVIEGDKRFLRALNPSWPEKMIPINGNATLCGVVIGKWTDA